MACRPHFSTLKVLNFHPPPPPPLIDVESELVTECKPMHHLNSRNPTSKGTSRKLPSEPHTSAEKKVSRPPPTVALAPTRDPNTMPPTTALSPSKKRKLAVADTNAVSKKAPKAKKSKSTALASPKITQEDILQLEKAIVESAKHYNNIATLLSCFKDSLGDDTQLAVTAAVSLCRTFCRLMAKGRLLKRKGDDEDEATVVIWLKERYREYVAELCKALDHESGVQVRGSKRVGMGGFC